MRTKRRALAGIVLSVLVTPLILTAPARAAGADNPTGKAPAAKATAAAAPAAKAPAPPALRPANLSAAQIIEKHVAARGGAPAWKAVQTLQLSGTLEAGRGDSYARTLQMLRSDKRVAGKKATAPGAANGATNEAGKQVQLPFTLDVKRPHQSRLEIAFAGKTAVQVFDGAHGWKLRPYLNRTDTEPFTAEEARAEAGRDDLEGVLFNSAAKGIKVSVEGTDTVDGKDAYKLKLTRKDGATQSVWIDAQTFLDVKVQGTPRRLDGRLHDVFVYQRDFRSVQGVMIPFVLETAVDGYPDTHKMIIDKAVANPPLEAALFTKPHA